MTEAAKSPKGRRYLLKCRPKLSGLLRRFLAFAASANPARFQPDDPPSDFTDLSIRCNGFLAQMYFRVQNMLRVELCPHRATDSEVVTSMWELLCDVVSNHQGYSPKGAMRPRVNEFISNWDGELAWYEVAYTIEYLQLGANPIAIGPVTFVTPDEDRIKFWGFEEDIFPWQTEESRAGPMSIATNFVQATEHSFAYETGMSTVLEALDVLKIAALIGMEHRLPFDQLLRWKIGRLSSTISQGEGARPLQSWHSQNRPLVTNLGSSIEDALKADNLVDLVGSDIAPDIRLRLLRAVHWISHSAIHDGDDYKIVDLCTALETMLLPNYNGSRKGHLIAIRYNLLLHGGMNPGAVKWWYDLRSRIVHGSALAVAGVLDTWHLRLICHQVLGQLLRLAKMDPSTSSLEDLVNKQESLERLAKFIDDCDKGGMYDGRGIKEIRNFAVKRLQDAEPLC